MRNRKMAVVTAVLLLGLTGVALGHYVYDFKYVWENGRGKCLKGRAEISDGDNQGGYSKINAFPQREQDAYYGTIDCATGWSRDLKIKTILQKETNNGWTNCRELAWKYGYGTTELQQAKYWDAPCGAGYYRTKALLYLKYNGVWEGGPMTHEGKHWLK